MPLVGQIITAKKPIKIYPKIGSTQYTEIVLIGQIVGKVLSVHNNNGELWLCFDIDQNNPTGYKMYAKLDYEAMGLQELYNEGKISANENRALSSPGVGLGLLTGAGLSLEFIGMIFRYGLLFVGIFIIYKFAK